MNKQLKSPYEKLVPVFNSKRRAQMYKENRAYRFDKYPDLKKIENILKRGNGS